MTVCAFACNCASGDGKVKLEGDGDDGEKEKKKRMSKGKTKNGEREDGQDDTLDMEGKGPKKEPGNKKMKTEKKGGSDPISALLEYAARTAGDTPGFGEGQGLGGQRRMDGANGEA